MDQSPSHFFVFLPSRYLTITHMISFALHNKNSVIIGIIALFSHQNCILIFIFIYFVDKCFRNISLIIFHI